MPSTPRDDFWKFSCNVNLTVRIGNIREESETLRTLQTCAINGTSNITFFFFLQETFHRTQGQFPTLIHAMESTVSHRSKNNKAVYLNSADHFWQKCAAIIYFVTQHLFPGEKRCVTFQVTAVEKFCKKESFFYKVKSECDARATEGMCLFVVFFFVCLIVCCCCFYHTLSLTH